MKKPIPTKSQIITFFLTFALEVVLTYLVLSYLSLNGYTGWWNTPEYILHLVCGNDLMCRGEICLH